jgi:hypothetical protein
LYCVFGESGDALPSTPYTTDVCELGIDWYHPSEAVGPSSVASRSPAQRGGVYRRVP